MLLIEMGISYRSAIFSVVKDAIRCLTASERRNSTPAYRSAIRSVVTIDMYFSVLIVCKSFAGMLLLVVSVNAKILWTLR